MPLASIVRRREPMLWLLGAALVLGIAALAPLTMLVGELAGAGSAFGLWALPRTWWLLVRSLAASSAVTVVALAIGVPLGILVGVTDAPGRRIAWLLHAFPVLLPPLLPALGWAELVGQGGETATAFLFSAPGLVAVLGITFAPIVSSCVAVAAMGIDPSQIEAARVVAGPLPVARRILIPATRPALVLSVIVVLSLAIAEVGVPMFLRVDVFQTAVFARLGGLDRTPGEAIVLLVPLVGIAFGLLALERRLAGTRSFAVLGLRMREAAHLPLGRRRWAGGVICWLAASVSIAPLVVLAYRAWHGHGFASVGAWAGAAPWNGLLASTAAATLILGVGILAGHGVARRTSGAGWLDGLAVLAFIMPGPVLGVGLVAVWNRPATQAVYGTLAIVVVGFVARYAVIGLRGLAIAVAQQPVALEHAAAACGAGHSRRLGRIVLPLASRGAVFAWLLCLVFCLRDLETAALFYPPGGETLAVRIFTLEANGPRAVVAALAVLHAGITAAVLAPALLLGRRRIVVTAVLELDDVGFRHGDKTILDGLALSLEPGQLVVLAGASGSGKTTLLRLALGFTAPTSGVVRVAGEVVSRAQTIVVPPEDRRLAVVFQDLALWPHLDVREHLAFGLRGLPRQEQDARIAPLLERLGLADKTGRHPSALSGGEQQRLAIARALVLEPRAVLLDEPLASLDVGLKRELLSLFAALFDERKSTVLYVTHDLREAAVLCARIAVLDEGRVVQRGTLAELRADPQSPVVRELVTDLEAERGQIPTHSRSQG